MATGNKEKANADEMNYKARVDESRSATRRLLAIFSAALLMFLLGSVAFGLITLPEGL
jgi:hypothetical protein